MARTVLRADGSTEPVLGDLPPAGSVEMPGDWGPTLGEGFRGQVLYTRHFGCPTGLEQEDRVMLVVQRADAFATIALNAQPIGIVPAGGRAARLDISTLLKPRNQLAILVELPEVTPDSAPLARPEREGLPGGLVGEVLLEIIPRTRCNA
jgi:hypothetical protein